MVVTKEVSRFSRNILDTIRYTRELKALGIGVIFVSDGFSTLDSDAELRLSIMGSIAQEESRKTSARVKWGQTRQMERGVVFGHSMLGYDVRNGKMIIHPEGAQLVRLIFHKYAMEKKGTGVIARELQEAGYRTYSGNPKWSASHIVKILKNEKYVGDLIQKKTYTPDYLTHAKKANRGAEDFVIIHNHHEPIIDRSTWNLAQEQLKKNNRHNAENFGHSNRYVYSGKITCGECGSSFVSRQKTLQSGEKIRRWSCASATNEGSTRRMDASGNHIGCDVGKLLRDDDAIHMLQEALRALQIDKRSIVSKVTTLAIQAIQAGESGSGNDPVRLICELKRTEQKKENMMDSYFSGDISKPELLAMKNHYDQKLQQLQERLKIAEKMAATSSNHCNFCQTIEKTLYSMLNGEQECEAFYKNILEGVTVFKDRHMELKFKYLSLTFHFVG